MRSVFKKTLAAGIAAALTAGMLAGCGASAPKLDGTRTALVVNGQEVTLGTMSFYAKFQQAMTASYYAMYGMTGEIFDTDERQILIERHADHFAGEFLPVAIDERDKGRIAHNMGIRQDIALVVV